MADLYGRITDTILRQIDTADPGNWMCPWHRTRGGLPQNALTGKTYRGINTLSLWCGGLAAGYSDDRWATYRQWAELGAQVRKGERGTPVLFFKDLPQPPANDETDTAPRFVARASSVFNAEQVLGARPLPERPFVAIDSTPAFDRFVAATSAVIHPSDNACYVPSLDQIRIPERDRFRSIEGYCSTLAHELVHWTGSKARLDRDLSGRFGTRAYAAEELVAELGSAFVVAQLGIAPEPHPRHAAYLAGWLPLLRADSKALVTAASLASRSAEFLQTISTGSTIPAGPQQPVWVRAPQRRSSSRPRVKVWVNGARAYSHGW